MRKLKASLTILVTITHTAMAQNLERKYSVGGFFGLTQSLGQSGPKGRTAVSDVSFSHPAAKTFGLTFDVKFSPRYYIGLEFAYDEFEGGYYAEPQFKTGGITSGLLSTDERLAIYKAGLRVGKPVKIFRPLFVNFILVPSLAYSRYIEEDTARENSYYWEDNTFRILYVRYPRYQNTGLHFVVKAMAELQYTFRNHMSVTLDMAYQQGFRPFVVDTVNIVRRYEPGEPQHKYWTRYSGTSLQFHLGIKYDF